MKDIYLTLLSLLNAVPQIRFTDLDKGQLDYYETRPAVAFPCALISIEIRSAENMGNNVQRCTGLGNIRVAFDYTGETSKGTPQGIQAQSLAYFDLLEQIYLAVQGKTGGNGKFDRQSVKPEKRNDGLKVVNMPFITTWLDKSAANG